MKTVLYTNNLTPLEKRLKLMISEQSDEIQIESCHSIDHISRTLRQPLNKVSVMILLIASLKELVQINSMCTLFDNIRIILILPDRKKETLAQGFKLKSSFISYIDSDLQDVVSVLNKIMRKEKK